MPSPQEMLKEQVEKSVKLTRQMLDNHEGLEAKIKELEEGVGGAADLKEQVAKMSADNAKAIDTINELSSQLTDRMDGIETKAKAGFSGDGAPVDIAAPVIKALPERRMDFQEKVKAETDAKSFLGKTVTSLAASGGDAQIPDYEPSIIAPGQQQITLLDALPRVTTESPLIYWVVEVLGSRTDNAGIQSLDFTGTDQGTTLGVSDFVFDQKSAETRTYGHTAKIALQMLQDVGQLRGYLENQMRYMVRADLEDQILNGDGTGKNISGLKTEATAYDTTLDADVSNLQQLDILRVAAHQVALTFFPPTVFALHPTDAMNLELLKDGNNNYLFANPMSGNGIRPWGIPVISTTQQTEDDFTVFAANHVEVVIRRDIEVTVSTENDTDYEDLLATMRAYGRGGLKLYQPGSIVDGDFTTALA